VSGSKLKILVEQVILRKYFERPLNVTERLCEQTESDRITMIAIIGISNEVESSLYQSRAYGHDWCRVMERLDFPIITPEWTAREELSLLEGIETYGIGNWADV
jgi:hypothetical protein